MQEIWKDVNGYEGLYQVSNLGRVKRLSRTIRHSEGNTSLIKGKLISPKTEKDGYVRVSLSNSGRKKTHNIHRLVCFSFIKNPNNKPDVNHINGIKSDNSLSNLEWCTKSENMRHAIESGLHTQIGKSHHRYGKHGSENPCSKPVVRYDLDMNFISRYDNIKIASESLGIFAQNISATCRGNQNTAGGFKWRHA